MTEKGPSSQPTAREQIAALVREQERQIAALTADRDEAWRFIAALALNGPVSVTHRALEEVPAHPEFVRWDDPATFTVRVRLVNGKGSS